MPHGNILDGSKTALVVVDVQEAFRHAIGDFALAASNVSRAVRAFSVLGIPVLVTEQYPKRLGPSDDPVRRHLTGSVVIHPNMTYSAAGDPTIARHVADLKDR